MSRNAGGTYTLPAGNPPTSNSLITVTWASTTLSDVATEITNSLDRSGRGGMLAALRGIDGTVGAPALSFTSEPASGLWRSGTNDVRMSVNGTSTQVWVGARVLFGRLADSTNAKVQVESSTDSNLLELQNTSAAQFGGILLKSNDRTLSIGIRSSTHGSGEQAYFSTSAATVPLSLQINGTEGLQLTASATPAVRVANQLLLSSAATTTSMSLQGTGNVLTMWGGSSGWKVKNSGGAADNLSMTDAGVLTVRTGIDSPYFNATSHRRFKRDIRRPNAADILLNVRLASYELKSDGNRHIGLIHDEAPEELRAGNDHIDVYATAAVAAAGAAEALRRLTQLERHVGLQG